MSVFYEVYHLSRKQKRVWLRRQDHGEGYAMIDAEEPKDTFKGR